MAEETKKLTYGEHAVGLTFNHGVGLVQQNIHEAKTIIAKAIDFMNDFRNLPTTSQGAKRHASVAITDLETAQMRMVKAVTWTEQDGD